MAWTEPGKDKQPNNEQGPPDLDKILRDFSQKIAGLFGKKNSQPNQPEANTSNLSVVIGIVVGALVIIWFLSGIYIVSPAEQAVVLKFGRYQITQGPGPHWIPRFIESETTLDVQKIATYSYESQMLTKDQNIVDVAVAVQYKINNAKDYLFNVADPDQSLQQATASALRQVIGNTNLDDILTSGRAVVRDAVVQQLNAILPIYKTGIVVSDVALQPAKAPEQVKDSFDDAIKAQEDEQRYINQAQAYAKGVVPIAQGNAQRILQEAIAYRQQVVLTAKADVARYLAILPAYHSAPDITRQRMYLTTVESILSHVNKILLDAKNNQNVIYLPIDKLTNNSSTTNNVSSVNQKNVNSTTTSTDSDISNNALSAVGDDRPQRFALVNPDSQVGR